MQIVIELTDEQWKCVQDGTWCGTKEILNGIPLPKGHGKLIDADRTIKIVEEIYNASSVKDIITPGEMYAIRKTLTGAPTIIEADGGAE